MRRHQQKSLAGGISQVFLQLSRFDLGQAMEQENQPSYCLILPLIVATLCPLAFRVQPVGDVRCAIGEKPH